MHRPRTLLCFASIVQRYQFMRSCTYFDCIYLHGVMFVKRMIIDQSSLVEHSWIHIDATEGDTVVKKVDKVID